ncbi:MAG: antitermination protein NusB [Desulfovibrio sp.]|nr:antitermination protein NusB [Desulfovibrio sp.]
MSQEQSISFFKGREDVRNACLLVLRLLDDGWLIQEALSRAYADFSLNTKDRHLLSELAFGILRNEDRLEFIRNTFLQKPERLPVPFLHILNIAIYSLLFLERLPHYAVFSSAQKEITRLFGLKLARLAIAVLHRIVNERANFLDPSAYLKQEDPAPLRQMLALARYYSLPYWLLHYWQEVYGTAASLHLCRRSSSRPASGLLVNAQIPSAETFCHLLARKLPTARTIGAWGFSLSDHSLWQAFPAEQVSQWHTQGRFSWQSPGSLAVVEQLGLRHWQRPVWDMCAGFGGKSALLAQCGVPIALCTDTARKRLQALLPEFLRRALPVPLVCLADAAKPPLSSFDGHILLDAPCSGLGILNRRPDLRRKRKNKRCLRLFPKTQRVLLEKAVELLAPGCELAYITCTLNPCENEQLIAQVLEDHPHLEIRCLWQTPHDDEVLEGMFGVLLRRPCL